MSEYTGIWDDSLGIDEEFADCNDYGKLEALSIDELLEYLCKYVEAGYIGEDHLSVRMVEFYGSRGYLTPAQREVVIRVLAAQTVLDESFYSSEIKTEEKQPGQVKVCHSMAEYLKHQNPQSDR